MDEEEGYKVSLNMYDSFNGRVQQLHMAVEAVWYTGVVVYGIEYFFMDGIQRILPGRSELGPPLRTIDLGVTHVPKNVFEIYLQEISPRYRRESYSLMRHSCNNFSEEVAQFLVGTSIPDYILDLPNELLRCPVGARVVPLIEHIENIVRTAPQVPLFSPSAVHSVPQVSKKFDMSSQNQVKPLSIESLMVPNRGSRVSEEAGLRAILVQRAPRFRTSAVHSVPQVSEKFDTSSQYQENASASSSDAKLKTENVAPPAIVPAGAPPEKPAVDPLGDARNKVQEEIEKEFAAIMASGTLCASEAAALATKKVMQKYGHMSAAQS